jgi:hypothetical protein
MMIKRWIVQIEWYPFLGHRLPRIRIASAPYPGQVVFDKGWGYRVLEACTSCSGVGFFDRPLSDIHGRLHGHPHFDCAHHPRHDDRGGPDHQYVAGIGTTVHAWISEAVESEKQRRAANLNTMAAADEPTPGPQIPAQPRAEDDRVDPSILPAITGERVSDSWQDTDDDSRDWAGREPETPHYECLDYPCHKFHDS